MTSSFISQGDSLTAVPGAIYSFEGATLKAQTQPSTSNSKDVATTEWVKALLGVTPSVPTVVDAGGLNVNYTSGTVTNPFTGTPIYITGSVIWLAVGASTVEYIWVRYLDGAVVASSVIPSNNLGYLLATVTTNATSIVSISSNSSATGWAPINSPSFVGTVTAPNPHVADNSNVVPTTSWVRNVVQSTLLGSNSPILSIGTSGTSVQWSGGVVSIGGVQYPVIAGQYTFTSTSDPLSWTQSATSQGVYSVYAVLVGGITTVVVSANAPSSPNVLMGTVSVSGGVVGQVSLPSTTGFAPIDSPTFTGTPTVPSPPLGDDSARIATTEWVLDVVPTRMATGFGGVIKYI